MRLHIYTNNTKIWLNYIYIYIYILLFLYIENSYRSIQQTTSTTYWNTCANKD